MRHNRFSLLAGGVLAPLAAFTIASAPAQAGAPAGGQPVSTGHSSWYWGFPRPQGLDLNAVAFDGATGYAVGAFGTVLRSDDSGATWTGLPSGTMNGLHLIDEVDPSTVVVAGGCVVTESTDGGAQFTALPLNLGPAGCVNPVEGVSFSDAQHGYVELQDGSILYTDDGGATLQAKTSVPLAQGLASGLTFTSSTTGFAITSGGAIEETTDGGDSWTLVYTGTPELFAITFVDANHGYAVGQDGAIVGTTDGGATWKALPLKLTSGASAPDLNGISCASVSDCLMTTDYGNGVVRTSDGGQTGTLVTPSNEGLGGVAFAAGSTAVAVGTAGATVVSTDGGATFPAQQPNNLRSFTFKSSMVAGGAAGGAYAGGSRGEIAATTDGGGSWGELRVPTDAAIVSVQFPTASDGYALDRQGALRRTSDGGVSWRSFPVAYNPASTLSAPSADTVLLVGPTGISRSTDAGSTFARVPGKVAVTHLVQVRRHKRYVAGRGSLVSTLRLVGATTIGQRIVAYGASGIVESGDGGATWNAVRTPVPPTEIASVSFVGSERIWALTLSDQLFATSDAGRTWTSIGSIGGLSALDGVSFSSAKDGMLGLDYTHGALQGTSFGNVSVLSTTDGGLTWQPELSNAGQAADVLDTPSAAYMGGYTSTTAGGGQPAAFVATTSQGRLGNPSSLAFSLDRRVVTAAQLAQAGHRVTLHGTLSPVTITNQNVVVSYRAPGGAWKVARAIVATGGSFSVTIPGITGTTDFVAQSLGNGINDGAGTPVQELKVSG